MNIQNYLKEGKNIYELNLKVTYYARVSTENVTQSTSITNQVEYFQNLIKNIPNWTLVEGYVDEGISGKDTSKREQFLKMINDGLNQKFNLILTKSVSRFARNTIDSIHYTNILLYKGVGVYFTNDNINTFYSDSEFRLTLMASIAQDELRKLSESVKFGLNESVKRGVVLGNNNMLGYTKTNGTLKIIPKEAQIVKKIYNLFITDKYTLTATAKIINQKYNKNFDSTSIKRILTNPKYKGYYCGKKTTTIDYKNSKRIPIPPSNWILYKDPKIPPIINEITWNTANNILKKRKPPSNNKNVYCTIHLTPYITKKKHYKNKTYIYWMCPYHLKNECPSKILKESDIELLLKNNPNRSVYLLPEPKKNTKT